MIKLRNRIEDLQKNTGSLEVNKICELALYEMSEIDNKKISFSAKKELESNVIVSILEQLSPFNESSVIEFVKREKTGASLQNLGVKDSLKKISESDVQNHPAISYAIKGFEHMLGEPEFMIAEQFYTRFKQYDWHPVIGTELKKLQEKAIVYKDDIEIQKAIYNLNNSRSSYLLKGVNESLELFLYSKSKQNKEELVEKLERFSFDANIRNLKNAVVASTENNNNDLYLKEGKGQAVPKDIYSIVNIHENSEIFGTGTDFYIKTDNTLRKLSETETNSLNIDFKNVIQFLNGDNVKIIGESITIYGSDRKFLIESNKDGEITISVNGNTMTNEGFYNTYMKSGVLNRRNTSEINMIKYLVENFNSITKIDFAKRIISPNMANRRIDIFKLNENIYITKEDPIMHRVDFFKNLNATQSRNLVIEYLNYDISNTFESMIKTEGIIIQEQENTKKSYIKAISNFETKLYELQTITDTDILETLEYKSILEILSKEIEILKEEYNSYVAEAVEFQDEPIPDADAGKDITLSLVDRKFNVDDKVKCTAENCSGTIMSFKGEGDELMYDILTDDGKTISVNQAGITMEETGITEAEDSSLEDKLDKVTNFLDKLGDLDGEESTDDSEDEDDEDDEDDEEDDKKEDDEEKDEFDIDGLDSNDPDLELESENVEFKADLNEGEMKNIDLIAKNSKSEDEFLKAVYKTGKLKKGEETDKWLKGIYTSYKSQNESIYTATTKDTEIVVDLADVKTKAGDRVKKGGNLGTVQGYRENLVTVTFDNGKIEDCEPTELTVVEKHIEDDLMDESVNEDHSNKGTTVLANTLTTGDEVENKNGIYGVVQGIAGDVITVTHDNGSIETYGDNELYLVKKYGATTLIEESISVGDEVEMADGQRAKVNDISDSQVTVIDDQGRTVTIPIEDVTLISTIETDHADVIDGQATDGGSVSV